MGRIVEVRQLIRQISDREPLNPYQAAGMAAVIRNSTAKIGPEATLQMDSPVRVLMLLDRAGEEASPYLIGLRQIDSRLTLYPRFPRESLDSLVNLTSFKGRRQAISENLVPILDDIPNWLDVVQSIARYGLDRDDESLAPHLDLVMRILFGYLFAASTQPFDAEARAGGEYVLCQLIEGILKSSRDKGLDLYLPHVQNALDFLATQSFQKPANSFDRRVLEVTGIRSALSKRSEAVQKRLIDRLDLLAAQTMLTGLDELSPCSAKLVTELEVAVSNEDFPQSERFRREILDRVKLHGQEEIERQKQTYRMMVEGPTRINDAKFQEGVVFVKDFGEEWRTILSASRDMMDSVPWRVQEAFSEVLVSQILEVDREDVKALLIEGLCQIVVRLEKGRKQSSTDLVKTFAQLFLDRAYSSEDTAEVVSSLKALESLGVTLGRQEYFLVAQHFLDHLVRRPLIQPREKKYTIEDDDTGEPVVLAEEIDVNQAHVQHVKTLMAIIASGPRIMHRLIPYMIVQIEVGQTRLCDEDLIQWWISGLLRANCSVTHFLIRTLIKAIPYSLKNIGPLDALRLTAAGLAKELANRGVKPIGNFLGKLRGDIHWRGSIDNFHFCIGIIKYFATGRKEYLAEWMPAESMPYLDMSSWCQETEARGITALCQRIFDDVDMTGFEPDDLIGLMTLDTAPYRADSSWPEFSRRVVLGVIELIQGLHRKYFIGKQAASGSTVEQDLERLDRIISERQAVMEKVLTPDIRVPLPAPVTLVEGSENYFSEIEMMRRDQPDTPVILRAKKAGHAYAQKATYVEKRFEAFTRDLIQESLQETLATSVNNGHFNRITLENLPHALGFLDTLVQGASVNGHRCYHLLQAGSDLRRSRELGLTFEKVRDLLKIIKTELDDIHSFYRERFEEPFDDFLSSCPMDRLPRKLKDLTTLKKIPETDFFKNYVKTLYVSDLQARDGNLRVLETFIDKVELFLNQRLAESRRKVVRGSSERSGSSPFYFPSPVETSPCRIGLKAMLLRFAENTPGYFVVTTDQPLKPVKQMLVDPEFRGAFAEAMERLGKTWGRALGDPSNPGLFSVRSGSRVSMPGMMITVTNVGINDEIAERLAKNVGSWFAYDCYRRFLQEFSQAVFGVDREEFQELIDEQKNRSHVLRKASLSGDEMKTLAFEYKRKVAQLAPKAVQMLDEGRLLDVLIHCCVTVLHSFDSEAARKYREAAGIDGDWRTPVVVQGMVYGNMELKSSGTGVVSYNPFTMDLRGEFALGDQGTDVVSGKVPTIPVYDPWKRRECLASLMPEAWRELFGVLFRTAELLHFDTRLEFTIEQGRVFVLQMRKDRERRDGIPSLKATGYNVIAQGTGVYGQIFRGIMVTDRNQIGPFRHINKAQSIIDAMNRSLPECDKLDGFIFVVNDPIPEEIMQEVFSLPVPTALISRLGGRGAHAADIAKSLRKVYVGQVRQIVKFAGKPESVSFNDLEVVVGSKMIINGQTGEIALYGRC